MSGKNCWCGRDAETKEGYCIFHAPIDKKKTKDFWERFKTYFEETLEEYGEAENKAVILFDCSYFVFPPFGEWKFPREIPFHITFVNALFYGDADFAGTEFKGQAVFVATQFHPCPEFLLLKGYPQQDLSEYPGYANFNESVFSSRATFAGSKFYCVAKFQKGGFLSDAIFNSVEFHEEVDFARRVFEGEAKFVDAKFYGETFFVASVFKGKSNFSAATINGATYFSESEFRVEGLFNGIECFNYVFFDRLVNEYERDGKGKFIKDKDNNKIPKTPAAEILLLHGHFYEKAKVYLPHTLLKKWSFIGTSAIANPEVFDFFQAKWGEKGDKRKKLHEETLVGQESITYEDVGEVYRRLRLNYEKRLAYEAASDFHVGQMRMMLKSLGNRNPKKWFLWLYKYVSNFGESVGWPLVWFIGLWASFFAIWLVLPARHEFAGVFNTLKMNFDWPWEWVSKTPLPRLTEFGWYIWDKFWFTVKTFFTLPRPEGTNFEQAVGAGQRFLGVTIIAFFILALRRAFRR